jgi:hypothetical protein
MSDKPALNYRDPVLVRKLGLEALNNALGPIGAVYFMRQFDAGSGDYTAERDELLAGISMEDVLDDVRKLENG